jgi:hypothetical protein
MENLYKYSDGNAVEEINNTSDCLSIVRQVYDMHNMSLSGVLRGV